MFFKERNYLNTDNSDSPIQESNSIDVWNNNEETTETDNTNNYAYTTKKNQTKNVKIKQLLILLFICFASIIVACFNIINLFFKTNNHSIFDNNKKNIIQTYDDKISLTFNIPDGFDSYSNMSTHKRFYKKYASVSLSIDPYSVEKTYANLEKEIIDLKTDDSNSNINLSDTQKLTINGREFYYNTITYTTTTKLDSGTISITNYNQLYYYTTLKDEYTYLVEIQDNNNSITQDEIKDFLTITILENK